MASNGLSCILGFQNFPGAGQPDPPPLTRKQIETVKSCISSINSNYTTATPSLFRLEKEIMIQTIFIFFDLHVIANIKSLWFVTRDFIYL